MTTYYSSILNQLFSNRNLHTAMHWDNPASPGKASITAHRQRVSLAVLYTREHPAGNSMNLSGPAGSAGTFPVTRPVPMFEQVEDSTAKEYLHNQQMHYMAW